MLHWLGSSICVALATNKHILALESDSKMFEEVLKPLQVAAIASSVVDLSSTFQLCDDDEDALATNHS